MGIRNVHTNCKILKSCQFVGNYKHKIYNVWDWRLVTCVWYLPFVQQVKEAWCKVGNKTLGPFQSVGVKGKRRDCLKTQTLVPKCDTGSTTSGNDFGTFGKFDDFFKLFFDFF